MRSLARGVLVFGVVACGGQPIDPRTTPEPDVRDCSQVRARPCPVQTPGQVKKPG